MSKGIDYSKWDRMEFSDDESSEEGPARVTTLDGPSRVTRQADGTISIEPSSAQVGSKKKTRKKATRPKSQDAIPEDWTRNGHAELDDHLYWRQDRYNVELRYRLPKDAKGKDAQVTVTGALPYSERHVAVGSQKSGSLTISVDTKKALEGTFPHSIHLGEGEDEVDWLIETKNEHKFAHITLHKAVPMEGVTLWWNRALDGLPERQITSRQNNNFQDAWEEAHKQFRSKIQSTQKIDV